MSNLQRYGERPNKFGITQMLPDDYGLYVKFDDVKELRSSTDVQQLKPKMPSFDEFSAWWDKKLSAVGKRDDVYYYFAQHFGR